MRDVIPGIAATRVVPETSLTNTPPPNPRQPRGDIRSMVTGCYRNARFSETELETGREGGRVVNRTATWHVCCEERSGLVLPVCTWKSCCFSAARAANRPPRYSIIFSLFKFYFVLYCAFSLCSFHSSLSFICSCAYMRSLSRCWA